MRTLIGLLVAAGLPAALYLTLTPGVWDRDDLQVLLLVAALSAGRALGIRRRPENLGFVRWGSFLAVREIGFAAGMLVLTVGFVVVADRDGLETSAQRVVVTVALVVLASSILLGRVFVRRTHREDEVEREARREAIREDVRREIAEIERRARDPER